MVISRELLKSRISEYQIRDRIADAVQTIWKKTGSIVIDLRELNSVHVVLVHGLTSYTMLLGIKITNSMFVLTGIVNSY